MMMGFQRWVTALAFIACFSSALSITQPNTIYSTSWETSSSSARWNTLIKDWECPCPTARFRLNSTAAAHTGKLGVQVSVSTPSNDAWHVQLQSPVFNMSTSLVYTACIWMRTDIAGGVNVPMNLFQASTFQWLTGSSITVDSQWRQACIRGFTPASSTEPSHYFGFDFGLITGTLYIDDFTLTSLPNTYPDDLIYVNTTNTAARIEKYRRGSFRLQFVNKTTNKMLKSTKVASLKLRLAMHDFPFGTAAEWNDLYGTNLTWYSDTIKKHFNALVPEWSFKWPSYEPVQGQYQATRDYLLRNHVAFATSNDFVLTRGHTLEWPTSAWGFPNHWSRQHGCDSYRQYLYTHITRELTAFKGKFQSYDIFNEVLHELQFIGSCPGMWPGILYDAFRWAAAADPSAQLCLNDYGLIDGDYWQDMVALVSDMKANNVPISCVGVQAYVNTGGKRATPGYMKSRLDALASLNVSILITEFNFMSYWDDKGPVWNGTQAEHAALYDEYLRFWFSVPYIKGVLMWGFWDNKNWIRNGGIYKPNMQPKLAATTISKLWNTTWNTSVSTASFTLSTTGTYGPYTGYYGKYFYDVTVGTARYTGYVRFPAESGALQTATILVG